MNQSEARKLVSLIERIAEERLFRGAPAAQPIRRKGGNQRDDVEKKPSGNPAKLAAVSISQANLLLPDWLRGIGGETRKGPGLTLQHVSGPVIGTETYAAGQVDIVAGLIRFRDIAAEDAAP